MPRVLSGGTDPQGDPVFTHGTGDIQDYEAQWGSALNLVVLL